jgi:hypothetical protein
MVSSIFLIRTARLSPKMVESFLSIRMVELLSGMRQKKLIGIIPNGLFGKSVLILRDPLISLLVQRIVVPMLSIIRRDNNIGNSLQTDVYERFVHMTSTEMGMQRS